MTTRNGDNYPSLLPNEGGGWIRLIATLHPDTKDARCTRIEERPYS